MSISERLQVTCYVAMYIEVKDKGKVVPVL
jgi:hypothetical protein